MRALLLTSALLAGSAAAGCQAPPPPAPPAPAPTDHAAAAAAQALESRGDMAAAAEAWLRLAQAEPQHHDWVTAAGRCLARAGRFAEAVDLLQAARSRFPGSIEIDTALAKAFLLQAESPDTLTPEVRWADAAELAEGVLRVHPDDEDCRLILAQATYLLGDWQRAVREAEEAVRRHPQRAGAHVLLGRIASDRFARLLREHAAGGRDPQAEADLVAAIDVQRQLARRSFERAAELDPQRAHPHVALGQLAAVDHKTDQVRRHFVDALAIDPDTALDHSVFERELDWRQRRDAYSTALQRYTVRPDATGARRATLRWYVARALYDGGEWAAARDAFAAALADNPGATNCHYYLLLCHWQLGDHDAATQAAAAYAAVGAAAFADVVRALPSERRAEVGAIVQFLADRAFRAGNVAASRDLNHVIACLSDSADAWNNHAFLCRETGQFEAALASYRSALEKEPDSPQLLNDTAVVLHYHLPADAKNLQEARRLYERAIRFADEQLAGDRLGPALRQRAEQARTDARKNLAALPQ